MVVLHKKIYLAGAMAGISFEEQCKWRNEAKSLLYEYYRISINKYKPICVDPTDYYNFETNPPEYDSDREVMDFDLDLVRDSDIILVNWNYPNSKGTLCETAIAYDRGIPVIGICDDNNLENLHTWQKEMCRKILPNEESAARYITDFYLR